ncbi:MAG: hypothetical protein V7731_22655 [Amphritea sp.]
MSIIAQYGDPAGRGGPGHFLLLYAQGAGAALRIGSFDSLTSKHVRPMAQSDLITELLLLVLFGRS